MIENRRLNRAIRRSSRTPNGAARMAISTAASLQAVGASAIARRGIVAPRRRRIVVVEIFRSHYDLLFLISGITRKARMFSNDEFDFLLTVLAIAADSEAHIVRAAFSAFN